MYFGIDLGGTNTAAAVVSGDGTIISRANIHTNTFAGATGVVCGILEACDSLPAAPGDMPHSIGIGIPGAVDPITGDVLFTPNLPLTGVNIIHEIRKKYDCPVHIGNDANCAALGEYVAGGMKGVRSAALITLGTGIGGGLILGGSLHTGFSGTGGELGHMVIIAGGRKCGCGRYGCWESYASASGLIRTAYEFIESHPGSLLTELCGGNPETIDGRMVFDAFRAGDTAARKTVGRYIEHLAAGIVNIINVLDPEIICVGGGLSNAWDCLFDPLQAAVSAEKFTRRIPTAPQTRIIKAALGNDAGLIGAAMLGTPEVERGERRDES